MMNVLKKYVPNYHINLFNPHNIDDVSVFKSDLQMFIGVLKCSKDEIKMKDYIFEHEDYFSDLDYESGVVFDQVLNIGGLIKKNVRKKGENVNMCKAIQDMYDSAKKEGLDAGRQEGLDAGIQQGLDKMTRLVAILLRESKFDDLTRASEDEDYRNNLFVEYNL